MPIDCGYEICVCGGEIIFAVPMLNVLNYDSAQRKAGEEVY